MISRVPGFLLHIISLTLVTVNTLDYDENTCDASILCIVPYKFLRVKDVATFCCFISVAQRLGGHFGQELARMWI